MIANLAVRRIIGLASLLLTLILMSK